MRLSIAPYRLLFKHPFGTAHGLRDGTDSVFVRLDDGGYTGYGEATLPPYLPETQVGVIEEFRALEGGVQLRALMEGDEEPNKHLSTPARAALSTAYYDLISRQQNANVSTLLIGKTTTLPETPARVMVTLGHSAIAEIPSKLRELPPSSILKVKLGSDHDRATLEAVLKYDDRPLFLDANQGWHSTREATAAVELVGSARCVGLEQPFAKDRLDLHQELRDRGIGDLFGDESIQDLDDLERAADVFTGVNIKLMKCGGLDRAATMIRRARDLGLAVMLGSMSESSLGCGAMAQLAGWADLLDLDGPWLVANDPFTGLRMNRGNLVLEDPVGVGVRPLAAFLNWIDIGA